MKIEGLDQLKRWTANVTKQVELDVKQIVKETGYQIEADAKLLSPYETGHLRRSISTEVSTDGMSAEIGTNVEYAPFVEFGTSKQSAQAFLTPAFLKHEDSFIKKMEQMAKGLKDS